MKSFVPSLVLAIAGQLVPAINAWADDAIGHVRVLNGTAYVVKDGQSMPASVNALLTRGTQITTEPGASIGMVFQDNTAMALGPSSSITLDEYAYQPLQGQFKIDATINRGSLAYLAGAIAKHNPMAVNLNTPSGSISVRGSHFAIKLEDQ